MTIDERFADVELYVEKMEYVAGEMLLDVYNDLSERHIDEPIPSLEDLIEFTYTNMQIEVRDDMIADAVDRGDYENYKITRDQFVNDCYNGSIEDESVIPYIEPIRLRNAVMDFIVQYQLVFREGEFYENVPLQEVW